MVTRWIDGCFDSEMKRSDMSIIASFYPSTILYPHAQDILSRHKSLYAEFLDTNFDTFFGEFTKLLQSENYVTKRQSIRVGHRL